MSIPDYQTLMRPVLAHVADGEVRRTRAVKDSLQDHTFLHLQVQERTVVHE